MATLTRQEITERIVKLIHNFVPELQDAELDENSRINTDASLDSLSLILLITKVESSFDISIPEKEWKKINTLGELVDRVQAGLAKN